MTLAELQEYRTQLVAALTASARGKSYTISSAGGSTRSYTRHDLAMLRKELDTVNAEIARLSGRSFKTAYVRPMD